MPNIISKIIVDTDKKTYQVFNRSGKMVFQSEPLDANEVGQKIIRLCHNNKHKHAMKKMTPDEIIEYVKNLEKEIREGGKKKRKKV